MSLWICPTHGLYAGQIDCPKCGGVGDWATVDEPEDDEAEEPKDEDA